MVDVAEKESTECTGEFGVVYMWQIEGAEQHWLFLLDLFLWEQLLDILKVFGICENEKYSGGI